MAIPSFLKQQIKKAAPIQRLLAERDDLSTQSKGLLTTKAQLEKEVARLQSEIKSLRDELAWHGEKPFVPNGHFYSPIAPKAEIERDRQKIFGSIPESIPGIELNTAEQQRVLDEISTFYADLPFTEQATEGLRYRYENPAYSYSDAILLNGMIRRLKPKRVIEIGSGYSSAMLLDTNERWFDNAIACTFIEPYPDLLYSLLKKDDRERIRVFPTRLQEVDLSVFSELEANDILFIDSTHVSRVGSDVNYIFFQILPLLKQGVHVHIHDIFYPFEYPMPWIDQGRAWSELYVLRGFLQYNNAFDIVLFNTYMEHFFAKFFEEKMPLCMKNPGGSIWLRKN
jgi:predicted O-methyltransferase YrrM